MKPAAPLVLLHAFPLSARMWDETAAHFRPLRPVFAPNFPGFDGKAPPASPMTMDAYAQFVHEELDRRGWREPAVFAGVSMGGYVLFRYLALFPSRVKAAVLVSTRARPDTPEARAGRAKNVALVEGLGLDALAEKMIPTLLGKTAREKNPALAEKVRRWIQAGRADGVVAALRGMAERPDSTHVLARIQVPALVLAGEEDAVVPAAEMRQLAEAINGAQFEAVPRAGHLLNLEQAALFHRTLQAFLMGLD